MYPLFFKLLNIIQTVHIIQFYTVYQQNGVFIETTLKILHTKKQTKQQNKNKIKYKRKI